MKVSSAAEGGNFPASSTSSSAENDAGLARAADLVTIASFLGLAAKNVLFHEWRELALLLISAAITVLLWVVWRRLSTTYSKVRRVILVARIVIAVGVFVFFVFFVFFFKLDSQGNQDPEPGVTTSASSSAVAREAEEEPIGGVPESGPTLSITLVPEPDRQTVKIGNRAPSRHVYKIQPSGCDGGKLEIEVKSSLASEVVLQLGLDSYAEDQGRSVLASGGGKSKKQAISSINSINVAIDMKDGEGVLYLESVPVSGVDCNSQPVLVTVRR